MNSAVGDSFWTKDGSALLHALDARPDGLSSVEAEQRLEVYGGNVVAARTRAGILAKIGRRLTDPLVAILMIAALVSGATGDWQSCIVIVVIVVMSAALDIVQEYKAETAVEALQRSIAVTARVRRDGRAVELPIRDLVPGDVVELSAGDLTPADGLVLASRGALVNEALLTGEPYPVEKRAGHAARTDVDNACNALFSGTSVVGGSATMLVVATGRATRFGAIAASLQRRSAPTAFERGVHALGMLILRLTGFLVLFVLLTQLIRTGLSLESFLFAIALAVGLTPELLPMVMTVTLARGAVRMAARKVVVKRLSAIHDLGAMNVLCTDKTGTLTEAKIAFVEAVGIDGRPNEKVATLARCNSRYSGGMRSNLDDALLASAPGDESWQRIDDLPFDFERRRASVLVGRAGERILIAKGAPESLLSLCTQAETAEGVVPLDDARRAQIGALIDAKGGQGLRLLGIAWRPMAETCGEIRLENESALIFAGCAVFIDPPKASASDAVARLCRLGVRVKVISGDAAPVVSHLVEALRLPAHGIMSGDDVDALTDRALAGRVDEVDLFVRMSPEQKSRVVAALRARGCTVGFLGDGVNDAPAIHAADVGLSVDGGTDVARQAADIILLASDLGVLADGVVEGRRTYANIMKYLRMGTSSNFGNMLSMALASLVLPFLPLAPLQILLNNLIYDLSEIGIPFDAADGEDLALPRSWDIRSILRFTLIMGPLSSVFDVLTFLLLHFHFRVPVEVFRTAWFVESIATQILVIFIIRTVRPAWSSRPHPALVATSLGGLAVALTVALTPAGAVFGFVALPWPILAAIAGLVLGYLAAAELIKPLAIRG